MQRPRESKVLRVISGIQLCVTDSMVVLLSMTGTHREKQAWEEKELYSEHAKLKCHQKVLGDRPGPKSVEQ